MSLGKVPHPRSPAHTMRVKYFMPSTCRSMYLFDLFTEVFFLAKMHDCYWALDFLVVNPSTAPMCEVAFLCCFLLLCHNWSLRKRSLQSLKPWTFVIVALVINQTENKSLVLSSPLEMSCPKDRPYYGHFCMTRVIARETQLLTEP